MGPVPTRSNHKMVLKGLALFGTLMLSKTNKQLHAGHKSQLQGGRGLLTDQELLAVPHLSMIKHLVQAQEFTLYLKKVHTIAVPPLDASRVESVTLLSLETLAQVMLLGALSEQETPILTQWAGQVILIAGQADVDKVTNGR